MRIGRPGSFVRPSCRQQIPQTVIDTPGTQRVSSRQCLTAAPTPPAGFGILPNGWGYEACLARKVRSGGRAFLRRQARPVVPSHPRPSLTSHCSTTTMLLGRLLTLSKLTQSLRSRCLWESGICMGGYQMSGLEAVPDLQRQGQVRRHLLAVLYEVTNKISSEGTQCSNNTALMARATDHVFVYLSPRHL